jgi:DNA-binding SARP family transcriptional activator
LGAFELRVGGEPIVLPIGSQHLVALLALEGRRMARPHIAGVLWTDSCTEQSNGSLRSALCRVRGLLPNLVTADRSSLWLAPNVRVDLRDATQLAERLLDPMTTKEPHDLGPDAVHHLALDLLPGWYDDWVILEGERWRQRRLHALEALARALLTEGRHAEAVLAALAAVECDPLRESGQAIVIEAYAAEEKYLEATQHYRSYRSLLLEELGVEPSLRLQQLLVGVNAPSS